MKPANKTLAAILALLAIMLFAGCSSDSDSDDGFAGTTWTATSEGMTITITFETSGQVTIYESVGTTTESTSGTYSVSEDGSTVTIVQNGETFMQLAYSSSKLVWSDGGDTVTFTKS